MSRIIKYTAAGLLGAIIFWAIFEWTSLMPDDDRKMAYGTVFILGMSFGLIVGLLLGIAESLSGLMPGDAKKGIIGGALFGAVGGILGLSAGNVFYNLMFGLSGAGSALPVPGNLPPEASITHTPGFLSFFLLLIGRGFGWAIIGACIGLSQGIMTSSAKKMWNGLIGGLIGGGLGGSVFEILVWMNKGGAVGFLPEMIRFISFSITGASIGLFIGFVEEIAKQAWLVRLVGYNEGREYTLYKPATIIGRSEMVDIPVYTDPDIIQQHAIIKQEQGRYIVEDMGSAFGTFVNEQKITKERLRDGDVVTVGKTRFLFKDKNTVGNGSIPAGQASAKIPDLKHVCPFCGAVKDADGNCDCTVAAAPQTHPTQAAAPAVSQNVPHMNEQTSPFASEIGRPRLTVIDGPHNGQVFVLNPGINSLGRDPGRDISLHKDSAVSREHAGFTQEVLSYAIQDMQSTNGTYINGNRVTRLILTPGDIIQVGNTKLKYEV